MAEVQIERKEGGVPWWAWLLLILAVGFTLWWMTAGRDRGTDVATTPAVTDTTVTGASTTEPGGAPSVATDPATDTVLVIVPEGTPAGTMPKADAANPALPLAAMRANPDAYFNKWVSGLATVTEVVSNKGFWIEQDGVRAFVVKAEPLVESREITAWNKVSFSGMVVNPAEAQQRVPVMSQMDDETLNMLKAEPAFIHATNIEMQSS